MGRDTPSRGADNGVSRPIDAPVAVRRATVADGVTDAFVAERDGEIVGWATAGPGRDDDPPRPRAESFYRRNGFAPDLTR